jgi:hypothetical protein
LKIYRLLILIWFYLGIYSNVSFAQNTESKPLVDLIPVLEQRFNVIFTYTDKNIEGIFVSIKQKELSLNEYLSEIENQTRLDFKKLDSRYIAIRSRKNGVKISGQIIDQTTKEHIDGAVIYSEHSYAISNANGWFTLKVNQQKDSILIVRHTGYKSLHLKQHALINDSSKYELTPDVQALQEVVVNYIAKGLDKLPDGSIQMNVQNLEVLPGLSEPDILHAIQVLPGLQSINETVSDINTRGGTNDQSLVLWDGVKMYQTGHFFGLVSAFNSNLIHKTEIIKNGASAVYDEGVSGIIEMQQQDYPVHNLEVSTGLNMMSGDLILKTPLFKNLSVIIGARHSINQLWESPTYESYYKRAFEHTESLLDQSETNKSVEDTHNFSFYDLSCKLIYDISEKDKFRFSILNIDNSFEYEENAIIRDTLHSKMSHLNQSSILSNISYVRTWNKKHVTQLSAYVSNYNLDGTNVSIADNDHHLQKNEVLDLGIKLNSDNKINQTITLSSGYQFKEVGIRNQDNIRKPGYKRDAKDVLRIHSLYTEAENTELYKNLYLRAGLRVNYFSKFKEFSFEPRAVLNFKLSKHFSIEALAEKKSQHSTQQIDYQTDFLGIEKRRWVLSNNESIPLLKSQQLSVGIQYKHNNLLVSLEGYQKKVNGLITTSQGFQNQFEDVYSIGKYSAKGVELLINKRFKQANIWMNYALAQNNYHFKEFTPSSFPNNLDIKHTLSLGGSYHTRKFEVSGGLNYRTGKPYTKPKQEDPGESNGIVYNPPNSSRIQDYLRLDISARYYFNLNKLSGELGVSVWNILNRKNVINVFYSRNNKDDIEQVTQNALEFTPNVSLRLNF